MKVMVPDDETLMAMEAAFKASHPPTSTARLDGLRPTILRFYLSGYSRGKTFQFLENAGLIGCKRSTFFQWVSKNMNLELEAKAHADAAIKVPFAANEIASRPAEPPQSQGHPSSSESSVKVDPQVAAIQSSPSAVVTVESKWLNSASTRKKLSDEERRSLVAFMDASLKELEATDMGAMADRAMARLNERDEANRRNAAN